MDVNDDACILNKRVAFAFLSKLAPTVEHQPLPCSGFCIF